MPVHAIDRIGEGPWYDRRGRLIAMNQAGLLAGNRPAGDAAAVNDLPDETGQGTRRLGDTHDVITGSNTMGMLRSPGAGQHLPGLDRSHRHAAPSASATPGPRAAACTGSRPTPAAAAPPGVNLVQNGRGNGQSIGAGGGWGGFYCFALKP